MMPGGTPRRNHTPGRADSTGCLHPEFPGVNGPQDRAAKRVPERILAERTADRPRINDGVHTVSGRKRCRIGPLQRGGGDHSVGQLWNQVADPIHCPGRSWGRCFLPGRPRRLPGNRPTAPDACRSDGPPRRPHVGVEDRFQRIAATSVLQAAVQQVKAPDNGHRPHVGERSAGQPAQPPAENPVGMASWACRGHEPFKGSPAPSTRSASQVRTGTSSRVSRPGSSEPSQSRKAT